MASSPWRPGGRVIVAQHRDTRRVVPAHEFMDELARVCAVVTYPGSVFPQFCGCDVCCAVRAGRPYYLQLPPRGAYWQ